MREPSAPLAVPGVPGVDLDGVALWLDPVDEPVGVHAAVRALLAVAMRQRDHATAHGVIQLDHNGYAVVSRRTERGVAV